jgi:serine/threonine protein kinase
MVGNIDQLVGQILGQRYRVERAIGAGGMGAVYEATQLDLGRTVAIKVLLDVDPRGIARLRQEALTAGSLSCPHVVSIFDFQAPPGEPPFLVMEMLPGHSLSQLLKHESALAVPRAARIAAQMLIGLEAAHRAGVVHRDVKPSNTWLVFGPGVDEHVKVLDFGIAKMLGDGAAFLTTTGSVLGTPAYLAPEQLRGLPIDARADIHAMGVVLFEMLAGRRPWQSQGPSVYAEILERVPPPLHEIAPQVPVAVSQIVARALAKDPAARFARAADMRAALEPFVGPAMSQPATILAGRWSSTDSTGPAYSHAAPSSFGPPQTGFGTAPPQTGYGAGQPQTGYGIPPRVGMAPAVAATHGMVSPTVDYRSTAPLAPSGALPPAPARSSSPALLFLLGGGVMILLGALVVVAFLLGRDNGRAAVPDAGPPAPVVASAAAAAPIATPDAGVRAATATAGDGKRGAAPRAGLPPGTPVAPGADAAAPAAAGPLSPRCECETIRGGVVCIKPKMPSCGCNVAGGGTNLCPQPFTPDGVCPVRGPGDLPPYSAPGRKSGQVCTGFTHIGPTSSPGTGVTECIFCYGHDTFAGVDGAPCRGTVMNGGTEDGKVVCK